MLDLEGERGSDSEREMSEEAGKKNATGLRELFLRHMADATFSS